MTTTSNDPLFRFSFYRITANKLVLLGVLLLGIVGAAMAEQKRMGGMTNVKSFNDPGVGAEEKSQLLEFLEKVKPDAEAAAGRTFEEYKPVDYATQLVNGINYFVKVDTGDRYVFLRLYKPFQGEVTFSKIQDNKTKEDDLKYF